MADKEDAYSDEFDSCEDDKDYSKEIKPKRSSAPPRPKSAFKRTTKKPGKGDLNRPRPASVISKSTTHDMWLNAVKSRGATKNKGHVGKRTTAEYWTDTLRKTGVGMSTESGANSMTNLKKSQGLPFSSTSHFLRQVAGVEKTRRPGSEPAAKPVSGVPAYKEPEQYYDDILALKKQMMLTGAENSTLKSKLRRLEEDNSKKGKEIEQLLDPSKGEELRKTFGDRKADAGTMIQSLKQKVLKLEHQMREKETALNNLQSDLKTTKVDEMKIQMEQLYKEVVRLSQLKNSASNNHNHKSPPKETPSKLKALHETILRMNEKNLTLTTESKTLKQDLQKLMDDRDAVKEKEKECGDMTKRELFAVISKLEKKIDRVDGETMSVTSDVSHKKKEKEGKLHLQGTIAQKFDQLDKRETELLEDTEKQRVMVKRLKDDRAHYRKKCEDKDKEIKNLKKDLEEVHVELDAFYEKDKTSVTPRQPTPRRRSSAAPRRNSRSSSVTSLEQEKQQRVEEFRKQVAAQHIQRQWKQRKHQKEHEDDEKQVRRFREKHAVKRIERSWLRHKNDTESSDEKRVTDFKRKSAVQRIERAWLDHKSNKDCNDAAELIQAALRGHTMRKRKMSSLHRDVTFDDDSVTESDTISNYNRSDLRRPRGSLVSDTDVDNAVTSLQSVFRGHLNRKQQINQQRSPSGVGTFKKRQESISDRHSTPFPNRRPSFKQPKTPPADSVGEESDDSDDIFVSGR